MANKVTLKFRDQVIDGDLVNLLNDASFRQAVRFMVERIKAYENDNGERKLPEMRRDLRQLIDGVNLIAKMSTGSDGAFSFTMKTVATKPKDES